MKTVETIRNWNGLETLRPDLELFLARRCRDHSEVDDIVQETLIRAARYRTGLANPARLRGWVLRIAANTHRDHLRRESRLPRFESGDEVLDGIEGREAPPGEPADPDADVCWTIDGRQFEHHQMARTVHGALRLMRPEDRDVLRAYYDAGSGSAAHACAISRSLVKVRLFRARKRFRRVLRRALAREVHPASSDLDAGDVLRAVASQPAASDGLRRRIGQAVCVLALLAGSAGAVSPVASPRAALVEHEDALPAPASAREQLEHARRCKSALRGTRGADREETRRRAVEAYREVWLRFPEDLARGAEAAFRAGELLRAGGRDEAARSAFERARALGHGTRFRARAGIEIGHLCRRVARYQDALAAFESVYVDRASHFGLRDEALLWAGRVQVDLGRWDDAERLWRRVANDAVGPLDRVRAYDWIALGRIRRADLEGAAGVLEECRRALEEVALEETRLGERVRDALVAMRAIEELRRAIARRELQREADRPRVDR